MKIKHRETSAENTVIPGFVINCTVKPSCIERELGQSLHMAILVRMVLIGTLNHTYKVQCKAHVKATYKYMA